MPNPPAWTTRHRVNTPARSRPSRAKRNSPARSSHWETAGSRPYSSLAAGPKTNTTYQNLTRHVQFVCPFKPLGRDQDRGSSGIYIQDRYEVQILDTFGHPPEFNACGALYRQHSPSVNMSYPPLSWQT